jgi:hypothetical protein
MTNATIAEHQQDTGTASTEAPPESLDKVRDILFGGQMRAVESRLQGLESRLLQAQESLRSEFTKQLDALDATVRKEVQSLSERLDTERATRTEQLKSLGETTSMADADLREAIMQQGQALSAEIARLSERLSADLARSVLELKVEKASLATLASLFSDLASRLKGDERGAAKSSTRG